MDGLEKIRSDVANDIGQLIALANWHNSRAHDAAERERRATTSDCQKANYEAMRLHSNASDILNRVAADMKELLAQS